MGALRNGIARWDASSRPADPVECAEPGAERIAGKGKREEEIDDRWDPGQASGHRGRQHEQALQRRGLVALREECSRRDDQADTDDVGKKLSAFPPDRQSDAAAASPRHPIRPCAQPVVCPCRGHGLAFENLGDSCCRRAGGHGPARDRKRVIPLVGERVLDRRRRAVSRIDHRVAHAPVEGSVWVGERVDAGLDEFLQLQLAPRDLGAQLPSLQLIESPVADAVGAHLDGGRAGELGHLTRREPVTAPRSRRW